MGTARPPEVAFLLADVAADAFPLFIIVLKLRWSSLFDSPLPTKNVNAAIVALRGVIKISKKERERVKLSKLTNKNVSNICKKSAKPKCVWKAKNWLHNSAVCLQFSK